MTVSSETVGLGALVTLLVILGGIPLALDLTLFLNVELSSRPQGYVLFDQPEVEEKKEYGDLALVNQGLIVTWVPKTEDTVWSRDHQEDVSRFCLSSISSGLFRLGQFVDYNGTSVCMTVETDGRGTFRPEETPIKNNGEEVYTRWLRSDSFRDFEWKNAGERVNKGIHNPNKEDLAIVGYDVRHNPAYLCRFQSEEDGEIIYGQQWNNQTVCVGVISKSNLVKPNLKVITSHDFDGLFWR